MESKHHELVGQSLFGFQAALKQYGSSMQEYIEKYYLNHWMSDTLHACLEIRTSFVLALHEFFVNEGLLNIDRVQLCMITDPLAHDVEHVPTIEYKGQTYYTTHSMIYSKFLACHNPKIKGVFIDSPNIRLELESPDRTQRGKYLIDFSQFDVELRRNRGITMDDYLGRVDHVRKVLAEDMERAMDLFERMMVHCLTKINERNADALKELGVALPVPRRPFPVFKFDEAIKKYGKHDMEKGLGTETETTLFWVVGIPRENYDLIYPYMLTKGGKVDMSTLASSSIYNYDMCARSVDLASGVMSSPREILSGAIREWLYAPIVERMIDNRVIPARPRIMSGNIENIDDLGGYGPFLLVAEREDRKGKPMFPETYGGGIGIERTLYTLCRGKAIERIEQVTLFGKNPDSHQIYLF
jgi:aspartyl/asparaginyl-tRNA synthetase